LKNFVFALLLEMSGKKRMAKKERQKTMIGKLLNNQNSGNQQGATAVQVKHKSKRVTVLEEKQTPNGAAHLKKSNRPTVSVVIPALNEADNLPHVLPLIPNWVHEVLLVDGASTDDTINIARQLWPGVRVVQQQGRGKGAALRSGFSAARGDIIVMLDADGSTNPAEIPAFVEALLTGADFVKGSRFLQGGGTADMPLYRKLGNGAFVLIVRLLFGGKYSDLCYGYNAFWRRVLPALDLDGDGFEIETMMNIRALKTDLKVAEVPSFEHARVYGLGRLRTIPDGWRVLNTIFKEWKHRDSAPMNGNGRDR
jgi:glycosyltransferase involved in cell wall biosynthesis